MTKTTLLAAASAAAVLIAGGAQAGAITGSVGTSAGTPVAFTSTAPFVIASERTNAADATATGGFTVVNTLTNAIVVTAGTTQNYRVSFTFENGVPSATTLVGNSSGTTATLDTTYALASLTTVGTETVVTYIVTVVAPGGGNRTIANFSLNSTLNVPNTEVPVTVASKTQLLAGGVPTDIDNTTAVTVVNYAAAIGGFSVTSNNALAALSNFQFFKAGAAPAAPFTGAQDPNAAANTTGSTAELASNFTLAANATTGAGGVFHAGLGGTTPATIAATGILNGGSLVVTASAGQLDAAGLVPTLAQTSGGGAAVARTGVNASTATFALTDTVGDTLFASTAANRPDFLVTQNGTPVAISANMFSAVLTPTAAGGYTLPATYSVGSAGAIALDGVNFIAPWVSGSQAPSQTVVRVSNGATTPSGPITLRLAARYVRAPGVTTGQGVLQPAVQCSQLNSLPITVPAGGTLQIGAGELQSCFGDFLNADLQITIQSAAAALTAKARTVRSDGTFEASLGRFSGSVVADAAF